MEVVGSKMLYGLVIEVIAVVVLVESCCSWSLRLGNGCRLNSFLLKQVVFKSNSVHAAVLKLVAAKGVP